MALMISFIPLTELMSHIENYLFCSCMFAYNARSHACLDGFQESELEAAAQWQDSAGELLFECPYPGCDHSFKYKGNLNVHQRKKHGGIYGSDQLVTFFCRALNCGRTFYSRGALAKHQRCAHYMFEEEYHS